MEVASNYNEEYEVEQDESSYIQVDSPFTNDGMKKYTVYTIRGEDKNGAFEI